MSALAKLPEYVQFFQYTIGDLLRTLWTAILTPMHRVGATVTQATVSPADEIIRFRNTSDDILMT